MGIEATTGADDGSLIVAAVASLGGFVGDLGGLVSGPAFAGSDDVAAANGADPLRAFADGCLDGLSMIRHIEAATAAAKVRLTAGFTRAAHALEDPAAGRGWVKGQEMAVVAEVACVLTIGERAAGALIGASHALTSSLPAALDALQAGTVSWQNAQVIVDEATGLDPDATAALEAHFLGLEDNGPAAPDTVPGGLAGELPPARLRRKVRSWRERHQPESIEVRHARGVADRRMEYSPDRDGMALISLFLPADKANACWNRTRALARALQGPNESRTMPQLMADIGATALLSTGTSVQAGTGAGSGAGSDTHGAGSGAGADAMAAGGVAQVPAPKADVLVMVPVLSMMGITDEPAVLDGHGPIPASMARQLIADGAQSFYRVLVDPRNGAPLEISRTNYRISAALRAWLRLRDGRCTFPGCSNASMDNEADHLLAWQHGGTTGITNLGQLCPKHHRMKHGSGWTPTPATKNEPPGYISPFGRTYTSEQQDWEPPHLPPIPSLSHSPEELVALRWKEVAHLYPDPPPDESGSLIDLDCARPTAASGKTSTTRTSSRPLTR